MIYEVKLKIMKYEQNQQNVYKMYEIQNSKLIFNNKIYYLNQKTFLEKKVVKLTSFIPAQEYDEHSASVHDFGSVKIVTVV